MTEASEASCSSRQISSICKKKKKKPDTYFCRMTARKRTTQLSTENHSYPSTSTSKIIICSILTILDLDAIICSLEQVRNENITLKVFSLIFPLKRPNVHFKRSYYALGGFCLSIIVFCSIFVHVKVLQREKTQSPRQRELLSLTEYAAPPQHWNAWCGVEPFHPQLMCITM